MWPADSSSKGPNILQAFQNLPGLKTIKKHKHILQGNHLFDGPFLVTWKHTSPKDKRRGATVKLQQPQTSLLKAACLKREFKLNASMFFIKKGCGLFS